jgi:glycosyltransferase involved in cell wall biosynthesis
MQYLSECFSSKDHGTYLLSSFSPSRLKILQNKMYETTKILRLPMLFVDNAIVKILNILTFFVGTLFILCLLQIQIVVLSIPPEAPALGSFLAARILGTKIIVDYRDEYGGSTVRPIIYTNVAYYRVILEKADRIIAVTYSFIKNLQKTLRNKKISYVANIANTKIFRPIKASRKIEVRTKLGLNSEDFIIIYTGILNNNTYNLKNIVQSIKRLSEQGIENIKLLIAGDGPSRTEILKMAKAADLGQNIVYLGVIEDPKILSEIISAADVGVIPYVDNALLNNCIPMKFYEYCSCGIPIIATATKDSEIAVLTKRNKLGLIAEPDNSNDLSLEIEKLLRDQSLRKKAGENARILIEKNHSKESFYSKYMEVIDLLEG